PCLPAHRQGERPFRRANGSLCAMEWNDPGAAGSASRADGPGDGEDPGRIESRRRAAGGRAQTTRDREEKPAPWRFRARKKAMKPRKTGPKQASRARPKKMKPR